MAVSFLFLPPSRHTLIMASSYSEAIRRMGTVGTGYHSPSQAFIRHWMEFRNVCSIYTASVTSTNFALLLG